MDSDAALSVEGRGSRVEGSGSSSTGRPSTASDRDSRPSTIDPRRSSSIRWGLCCQFIDAGIKFRTATHRYVATLEPTLRRAYLFGIARDNAAALLAAVEECRRLGIGAFRINSQILPLSTHPRSGYRLPDIDPEGAIERGFRRAGVAARDGGIRLSFHPDQFVVLNSARDDRHYAPADLLPLCRRLELPLVYDVHHHRCRPDGRSVEDATALAAETWGGREPYHHISSPRDGWDAANPRPHADYVAPADFPDAWVGRRMTVDVEAKAKERAVVALKRSLDNLPGGP